MTAECSLDSLKVFDGRCREPEHQIEKTHGDAKSGSPEPFGLAIATVQKTGEFLDVLSVSVVVGNGDVHNAAGVVGRFQQTAQRHGDNLFNLPVRKEPHLT